MNHLLRTMVTIAALWMLAPSVRAQRDFSAVQIEIIPVAAGVYMLVGMGGNIGVSIGEDGVFLVDDQFAPLTEKVLAAVATLTGEAVQFVVNTHHHGDHVGGNENLGKAGAIIVAHENVRSRMSVEQLRETVGRAGSVLSDALPVVTFSDGLTFHWNAEQIVVFHHAAGHAHTDGDAIVQFVNANVFHMGDTYFNGMYPFIDVRSGGNVQGLIAVVDHILQIADDSTRIIPGHGPLSNKAELAVYRDMLSAITRAVEDGMDRGLSLEAIIALEPASAYDADWGGGFISAEALIGAIYASLADR